MGTSAAPSQQNDIRLTPEVLKVTPSGLQVQVRVESQADFKDSVLNVEVYNQRAEAGRVRYGQDFREHVDLAFKRVALYRFSVPTSEPLADRTVVIAVGVHRYGSPEWGPTLAWQMVSVELPGEQAVS